MLSMTLVVGALLVLTLFVWTSISTSSKQQRRTLDYYLRPDHAEPESTFGLREVCRSVLNTNSLRFVSDNAPAEVVNSYETQQRRLAGLSLQVASGMLVQRLAHNGSFVGGSSQTLASTLSKVKSAFLLGVCTIGRIGLVAFHGLSNKIAQRIQILVSARILTDVENLLIDTEQDDKTVSKSQGNELALRETSARVSNEESGQGAATKDILRALLVSLPNDLSRLIFLAILRDNNSGHYHHPEVAQRYSEEVAYRAMLACHQQVYQQVVALSLEDLTDQLDAYMATVRVPKERSIESWSKLRAYRATIPMDADPISAEIFFMKVEVAVAILGARLAGRVQ